MDSVRWRSALFGLSERKRMEGQRGRENHVSEYWGRVMKKKEEKRGFMERERIHASMVTMSLTWCSGSGSHKSKNI